MSKILVINDTHLGVQRSGGTTNTSAEALRVFALQKYKDLLELADEVIVNGDLFDTYQIPTTDLLQTYLTTAEWLFQGDCRRLHLIPGNHDLSKNSSNMSSFELMARLLVQAFPDRVQYLPGGTWVDAQRGIYAISHVANQDLLDLELSRIPDEAKFVLLHLNFDNTYACQSDHSLNISRDQAKALTKAGKTLILGHEHQGRSLMGDKVVIVGNQFPSSISDCLSHGDAQADGIKYALSIDGDDLELIPTWAPTDLVGGYKEVDWRDLDKVDPMSKSFIRVSGKADATEAAAVIKSISTLRQASSAFVITNAVKVDAVEGEDEIEASIEEIKSVNVIDLLLAMLDEEQQAVVRNLMKEEA